MVCTLKKKASRNDPGAACDTPPTSRNATAKTAFAKRKTPAMRAKVTHQGRCSSA